MKNIYKILVIGPDQVGKTALVGRYINNLFAPAYKATVGVDFLTKEINQEDKLQIWDTAGQEKFRNISQSFYRGTDLCIAVVDASNPDNLEKSLNTLASLIKEFKNIQYDCPILLVGNKIDSESYNEQATKKHLLAFASESDIAEEDIEQCVFLTSAKENANVNELFTKAFEIISTKYELSEQEEEEQEEEEKEEKSQTQLSQQTIAKDSINPTNADQLLASLIEAVGTANNKGFTDLATSLSALKTELSIIYERREQKAYRSSSKDAAKGQLNYLKTVLSPDIRAVSLAARTLVNTLSNDKLTAETKVQASNTFHKEVSKQFGLLSASLEKVVSAVVLSAVLIAGCTLLLNFFLPGAGLIIGAALGAILATTADAFLFQRGFRDYCHVNHEAKAVEVAANQILTFARN